MSQAPFILDARPHDLVGFRVSRVLPQKRQRAVGPFVFLDHMGPAEFAPGQGIDVRPHPHIGLATVTYLFEGEIVHRDSLGIEQAIHPGDINWMTAGRGIVHSERSSPTFRERGGSVHGLQLWVALPKEDEETEPSFHHHPKSIMPKVEAPGVQLSVLAGEAYGRSAPVKIFSPLFFVHADLAAGAELELPEGYDERSLYVVRGSIRAGDVEAKPFQLIVFGGGPARVRALSDSRVALLGGAKLPEPRHMVWNFVSTSAERIERASEAWRNRQFPLVPGDEVEFTPQPEGITRGK